MSHYYTGVGSRETPSEILSIMKELAKYLAKRGMVLRSGAANGADTAFEQGCNTINPKSKEIYLPWAGFNHRQSRETGVILQDDRLLAHQASQIAQHIHPVWERLTSGAKSLHTRNVYQVLGQDLRTPSRFLVCWSPVDKDGVPKGGTRTAAIVAQQANIRVYNLALCSDLKRIQDLLSKVTSG